MIVYQIAVIFFAVSESSALQLYLVSEAARFLSCVCIDLLTDRSTQAMSRSKAEYKNYTAPREFTMAEQ